jgi:hypothetical protein
MSLWKRTALSLVLVLCAAIALAPSAGPSKRIPNGVRIAGVNVSGLDAGQATQQIGARFAVPVRFQFAREHWAVSPEQLGMTAEIGNAVSRARNAGSGDDIGVSVDVDRDKVKGYVASSEFPPRTPSSSGSSTATRRSPIRSGAVPFGARRWCARSCGRCARGSGRSFPS